MNLLGSYPSGLVAKHYDQLLDLLNQSLATGDYGGGALVNATVIAQLQQAAQDFSSLPMLAAGDRATADQITYMLSLLSARYNALDQERQDFNTKIGRLLTLLESESGLIDQLLAEGNLELWVARQGPLSGATQFYQDFAATHGPTDSTIPLTDPSNGVLYTAQVQDVGVMLNPVDGFESEPLRFGLGVPSQQVQYPPVTLTWQFPDGAQELDNETGTDYAQLSMLYGSPLLTYESPVVTLLQAPANASFNEVMTVSGQNAAGNVPIYVRILKVEQLIQASINTLDAGVPIAFSNYPVTGDQFTVLDNAQSYDVGIDYTVDSLGRFVAKSSTANKSLTILFTALLPGYQSSLNQQDWSSILVFDASNPYWNSNGPLQIQDNQFPILDDQNNPLGVFLEPLQTILDEYLLRIDTPVAATYGVTATLTVQLDKPTYMDGLHLAPFSTFPAHILSLEATGLTTDTASTIWSGDVLLDRAMSIRFDRQLVSCLTLTLYQENYSYQSYTVDPTDKLRRDALVSIQAVLPFSFRRINISQPAQINGVQYDLGITDIRGEDNQVTMPQDYGVIVSGPFEVEGTPELLRMDAQYCGTAQFYLLDVPFNAGQIQVTSSMLTSNPNGYPISPGAVFSYIPPSTIPTTSKVQFYLKVVLRDPYAVMERFLLQVTTV